jgi:hypothetical protein
VLTLPAPAGASATAGEPFTAAGTAAPAALHFLQVPGMRTILTPGLLAVTGALAGACARQRFLCVYGDAGVGKTFAVHAAVTAGYPGAHLVLALGARPGPAELRARLHHTLGLSGEAPSDPGAADTLIRRALAASARIVVVDEADRMPDSGFEYLRFLHDGAPGGLCVVLIAGQHGERALRRQQMLATRTAGWLEIQMLTRDQIPRAVPAMHPLWTHLAPSHLQALDARFAGGSMRRWALLTHHTLRALAAAGTATPGPAMLQALIDRIDTPRRP